MRLIPSVVKIGLPGFRGFLARFAPHPNIRKLREIAYFLYDTNKSKYQQRVYAVMQANNGACEGKGRDIIGVLSELGSVLVTVACRTPVIVQKNKGVDTTDKLSDDELISQMG